VPVQASIEPGNIGYRQRKMRSSPASRAKSSR
jgi:hypothetical protein